MSLSTDPNPKIGDTVIIRGELNKQSIGKVEDIKHEHGTFAYYEYLRPEEVPGGRKPYHGKSELIKSDRILEAKVSDVLGKCQIFKFNKYVTGDYDTSIPTFVFRQYYDATNKKLMPEKLETQYLDKVVNPDEELMANTYLNTEDNFGREAFDDDFLGKRKPHSGGQETVIPLKKQKAGFDFTAFTNKETKPTDKKTQPAAASKKVPEKIKVVSMKALTENPDERKMEMLMKKVDQKALQLLEKFRHSNPMSIQLPEQDRVRQKIRENLFYALVFGLEECRLRQLSGQSGDMRDYLVEVSKLLMKDEKSQLEHVKTLTMAIESNLYHKYNKEVSKTSAYSDRSRLIFMNLKHKKNFDLRLRVLVDAVTPSQLCSMSEDELAPKVVKNLRKEEQEKYLNSKLIEEEERYITKATKNEMMVGAPEDNGLPPLAIEPGTEAESRRQTTRNQLTSDEVEGFDEEAEIPSKVEKQVKDIYEELNPRKFAEKAEKRIKDYLGGDEISKQLIRGLQS